MSARNMTEVAFDPFGVFRDVEFERFRAVVCDFGGFIENSVKLQNK